MEKVLILNTSRTSFSNKETGEVVAYSTTTIGRRVQESENFCGYLLEEITGKVEDYNAIKRYVDKLVDVDIIYKKVDKKN